MLSSTTLRFVNFEAGRGCLEPCNMKLYRPYIPAHLLHQDAYDARIGSALVFSPFFGTHQGP